MMTHRHIRRLEQNSEKYNDHDYHVDSVANTSSASCPHCRSTDLVGFGRREQMIRGRPSPGKRVGVYVDTRR